MEFNANFSRNVLWRLAFLALAVAVAGVLSADFVAHVYFREQLTAAGYIINGGILLLFGLGMARVVATLWRYSREERVLRRFINRLEDDHFHPVQGIRPRSLIYRRYSHVLHLAKQNAQINHNALASMLAADESTRISFPRFINSILILTGVFGTIVSLAIALVGASDLLETARNPEQMGLVIHGMSTALSTTITAIVCYLFYGYFYLKLTDAQTHLLSGVEQATSLYLLPKYAPRTDNIMHDVAGLIRALQDVAENIQLSQVDYTEAGARLRETADTFQGQLQRLDKDLAAIKDLLQEGFRLPAARSRAS